MRITGRKRMDAPAAVYHAILEVKMRRNGQPWRGFSDLCMEIAQSEIDGKAILGVIQAYDKDDIIEVPCFGYSARRGCSKRDLRETPHGVLRVFAVYVVIEGPPDNDLLNVYEIAPYARIDISSFTWPMEPEIALEIVET